LFPKYGDADEKGPLGKPGNRREGNTKTDQGSFQRRGVQRERTLLISWATTRFATKGCAELI